MRNRSLFTLALWLAGVLLTQDIHAQNYSRWSLPEGALARLGKGRISWGERTLAYSPDGRRLAVATSVGIWLYDAGTGAEIDLIPAPGRNIRSLAFSPDGQTLASGSGDETIRLWDVATLQQQAVLEGHTGGVSSVAFSPGGQALASGGADATVRLWDVATAQQQALLEGHTDVVVSVAFSPDGRTLASGGGDDTIRLWDVATAQQQTVLEGHTNRVESVAFSLDGRTLASGSADGTILLWDMAPYVIPTAVASFSPSLPLQTALLANYPNPFNSNTYMPFRLHQPASVRLSIYDVRGALVRNIDVGQRAAGQYLAGAGAIRWDGRDHRGRRVASGVYLYRLQAGPFSQVRKMLLVK